MNQTIAILDASVGETPAERNLDQSLNTETNVYKVSDGQFPPVPSGDNWQYDGVVISGSQTSVYDDLDWIHDLTSWVRDVHQADIPTLGICWGHQFLAQSLGGRVVDMGEHELGYRTVHRRGEDPLFADIPSSFTAFQTHSDRVAELPPGSVELARNEYGNQAFRLGERYGVQFHPEYDSETAEWVIENKDLSDDRLASVMATITDESVTAALKAASVFENFLALVAAHQRQPSRSY